MRRLIVVALIAASACAPKKPPVAPVVSAPKFPDFLQPQVPAAFASSGAIVYQDRGWAFLQSGDLRTAEREFATAIRATPGFFPAEASLGYVELARKDAKAALPHFDRVLGRQADYAPALVGRGQALVALNRENDALAAFEAALLSDPSLADVRRRVDVLRFRDLQGHLARARQAAGAGQYDEAIAAYTNAIASSPESAFLYRELAVVERQKGEIDGALEGFRKALSLDSSDAASLVEIGDILASRSDLDGAAKAYSDAMAIEPRADIEAKLEEIRGRAELAALPDEYRAIDHAVQISRADLAALIGVRLGALLQLNVRREAVLITDVRSNWAVTWIMAVARAGVMEPFENHAFQPRAPVRRVDLAQAASRLLAKIAAANPAQARAWQSQRIRFSDLSTGHLAYSAASAAVASGVMTVGSESAFQPSRPVSGADALNAIARIEALAGPLLAKKGKAGQ